MATGAELECPMESSARSPGDLQIGTGGGSAVWTEYGADGAGRSEGRRTTEPYEIVLWTRVSGKVVRTRIDPAPGG